MAGYKHPGDPKPALKPARSKKRGRPRTTHPCGTPSAYALHRYHGEPIDEACRQANITACRDYRARKANA